MGVPTHLSAVTLAEITNENRTALIKRWKCAQENVENAMERFRMNRAAVENLAKLTLEEIEEISQCGYSLFVLSCEEKFFDLVKKVSGSGELGRLMVLQHG